nr:MucBP domain-containing protein [Enterococcus casseliflavus]
MVNDDEKSGSTESTEKNLPDSSKDTASSATESSAEMKEAFSNRSVSLDAWMPDKNLQNEVAKGLNKTVDTITQEDMVNLKQLDFSSLVKDTVVDFTGLEYASNLQALYTTSIIATNVPQITMAENATLFTRPNVLAHVLPKGSFSNIHIGNYDAYLTAQELIGVGQYLSGWVTDYLTVYASSMTDFSKLELSPEHHQNSQLSIMTQEKILLEPMLVKDGQSDVLYKDRMMVDTQGNALLSSLSNKKYSYSIRGIDKNGYIFSLYENDGFELTEEGIQFKNIPANVDYLSITSLVPNRLSTERAASTGTIQYLVNYQVPVKYVNTAEDVTVKYLDENGQTLAPNVTLSGYVGAPFTTEEKDISGYTLKEIQGDRIGTFSDVAQEVVYVYERSDAAPVTVKYEDTEGNQLSAPTVLSGKVGLPYTSEAKAINGWYVSQTPTNANGTYSETEQEVVYVYERSDAAPVTVKYEDTEGNELAAPTVMNGKIGLPYTSEAKAINGWYVSQMPTNANGTYSETAQEVVYVYERSDAAPVTVKYEDTEGNELAAPTVMNGKDDDTSFDEVKSPEIKNYHADKTSIDEVTVLTADTQDRELTVTYSPNITESTETKEVKQTIHYIYEGGKEAAPDKTDTVTFTRTVTTNEATGDKTFGEWQAKDDDTTFDEVSSPEIDKYNADQKTVDKVVELTAESEDREVTVTYSPNMIESTETKEVKQTIHYMYEDGKKAAPDKTDSVTFTRTVITNEATGDKTFGEWQAKDDDTTFDAVKSKNIDGYTADVTTVKEQTGLTVEDEDRELTVTYIKNPTEPTDPSKEPSNTPNDQTNPEVTTSSTDKEPTTKVPETTKTATSEKILPKTGEQATPYGLYGGVALVVASLLGLFMKRSKRKSE